MISEAVGIQKRSSILADKLGHEYLRSRFSAKLGSQMVWLSIHTLKLSNIVPSKELGLLSIQDDLQ
jgi:hypothetical protein